MKSIFVSSTFRDMHFERDVLNRRIAAKINRQLSQHMQSVRVLDLRWGIDTSDLTEQEASNRVLAVCMNAINDCKPYIIVLLGDRYGYIPDGSNISITHMEILRGVIENTEKDHVFIYFRKADYSLMPEDIKSSYIEQSEEAKASLNKLKAYLTENMPDRCKYYHSTWSQEAGYLVSDDFESTVLSDLEEDIVKSADLVYYRSALERQLAENEETLQNNLTFAYNNESNIDDNISKIENSNLPFGVIGEGGSGKSVYLSLICYAFRKKGYKANILFCGDNAFSASVRNAAEAMLYAIYDASGKKYDYEKFATLTYDELISLIAAERESINNRFVFILDAIDKCDDGMTNFIFWCAAFLSDKISLVFSSRLTNEINDRRNSFMLYPIAYTRDEYRKMTDCILNKYVKNLAPSLVEALLDKVKTPLQLQINIMRLLNLDHYDFESIQEMGGGIDAINTYLSQVIEEISEDEFQNILDHMNRLINECTNPEFTVFILSLLTFCEYGIHENELQEIFGTTEFEWVELDYIEFLEKFSFFIRTRDNGRIDISHDIIRSALQLALKRSKAEVCDCICSYYSDKEEQTPVSVRTFFSSAYSGFLQRHIIEYISRNHNILSSFESTKMSLGTEIRDCVKRMYFKDEGKFLLSCVTKCKSADELAYFSSAINSSMLSIDDYYSEDVLEGIARFAIVLPTMMIKMLGPTIYEHEKASCIHFLKKNNVSKKKIDEFIEYCNSKAEAQMTQEKTSNGEDANSQPSSQQVIDDIRNSSVTEKTLKFIKLSRIAREMSQNEKTAEEAKRILCELLAMLDNRELDFDDTRYDITYADIYTSLGCAHKALKEWTAGIDADEKSLAIYERLYLATPSDLFFDKYLSRVYNVANITEAWAIEEKDNSELWARTAGYYQKVYELTIAALSRKHSERIVVEAANAILSYGKSLINAGEKEEGIKKCKEGANILLDSVNNNENINLYISFCINIMDCVLQLFLHSQPDAAVEIADDIYRFLAIVAESDNDDAHKEINEICIAFSNQANDTIQALHDMEDIYARDALSAVLFKVYEAILPIAPHRVKANLISTKCNISATLFWKDQNYEEAYRQYRGLLDMVVEKGLAEPNEHGNLESQINARLVDAYIRCIICLDKLEREDELRALIDDAEKWGRFFADHIEPLKGNLPGVLFAVFDSLLKNKNRNSLEFLFKAMQAINDEDFDAAKHQSTVMEILTTIKALQDGFDQKGKK